MEKHKSGRRIFVESEKFKSILVEKAKLIGIKITESQAEKFYTYMCLLLEWNEKMNLTAITDPMEVIIKHFIDSITISKEIENGKKVIDIGTGAGFPGIPLKIVKPDISMTLLDSLNKRVTFLNAAIEALELEAIEAVHGRTEELGKNKKYREQYDYATSRAVANLAVLSEYMLPMVKVGGKCICMKGANVEDEILDAKKAIQILGGKIEKVDEFLLADTDMKRNIIVINKENSTPGKYPRKAGTPAKEPLK